MASFRVRHSKALRKQQPKRKAFRGAGRTIIPIPKQNSYLIRSSRRTGILPVLLFVDRAIERPTRNLQIIKAKLGIKNRVSWNNTNADAFCTLGFVSLHPTYCSINLKTGVFRKYRVFVLQLPITNNPLPLNE